MLIILLRCFVFLLLDLIFYAVEELKFYVLKVIALSTTAVLLDVGYYNY